MFRLLLTFLFSLFLISSIYAEEDLYSYKFSLDTTITGAITAEGNIFPSCETTLISFYYTYKAEMIAPHIDFFDENLSLIERITFDNSNTTLLNEPLVFDFDGDSFDEVVFAIVEPDRIWYLYFDPSNNPNLKSKIFEIPIKNNFRSVESRMISAQLDKDNFFELILSVTERIPKKNTINGMWAIDIEEKKVLWEDLSSENILMSKPINFVENNLSMVVYSGSSTESKTREFVFSNGIYFINKQNEPLIAYDKNFQELEKARIDTLVEDYSTNSVAFIRAVDPRNNLLWERKISDKPTKIKIDSVTINGKKRIILGTYTRGLSPSEKGIIEIINPSTGEVEKRIDLDGSLSSFYYNQQRVIITFHEDKSKATNPNEIRELNLGLNPIASAYDEAKHTPTKTININGENLLITYREPTYLQKIFLFDKNLNISGTIDAIGKIYFLKKLKLISVYDPRVRETKLFSILSIPWYDKISPTFIRNITISFLLIILVTMLLWINTLRVSSNKIKRQKKEIEDTHEELIETTSKLIRSEKLAVYGTIASGIAHEINSPLGAIINSAQRIKNNPSTDLEKNINLIEKAGKKSKAIIETLLVSTRKNSEDKTNLINVLNDWRELSQKQFENLGISFITKIDCNKLLAISSTELNQIFTNLFFNARDAISDNNCEIMEIYVSSQKEGNYCQVLIQDTGPGFSAEKLEHPFEAFETTKEKGKGTGLGLWVVKSILDNINGSIEIRNYEKGAEIEFKIPLFEKGNA